MSELIRKCFLFLSFSSLSLFFPSPSADCGALEKGPEGKEEEGGRKRKEEGTINKEIFSLRRLGGGGGKGRGGRHNGLPALPN